jgi:hypothetical protein
MDNMEKVKVLTVLVVVEIIIIAMMSFMLVTFGPGVGDEPDDRKFLRDFSESVAINTFKPLATSPPVDMILGSDQLYCVLGDGNLRFQPNSSWEGFVLSIGSDLHYSPNSTLYDPNGTTQANGGGTSSGRWASGQVLLKAQVFKIIDPWDHWNGTWELKITGSSPGDALYVMVLPILWYDATSFQ